jgi:hypothetical protein
MIRGTGKNWLEQWTVGIVIWQTVFLEPQKYVFDSIIALGIIAVREKLRL